MQKQRILHHPDSLQRVIVGNHRKKPINEEKRIMVELETWENEGAVRWNVSRFEIN